MSGRVSIERTDVGVRVTMPGPRGRFALSGFMLIVPIALYVLAGSFLFLRAAFETARSMGVVAGVVFAVLVLLLPVTLDVAVLATAASLIYRLFGREVVEVSPWMLHDSHRVFGLRWDRRWPALRVSNMRLSPMSGGPLEAGLVSRRGIVFDVDGRKVRGLGSGCTPAEAAAALEAIHAALTAPTIKR